MNSELPIVHFTHNGLQQKTRSFLASSWLTMIIQTYHITINFYFYFCCMKCNRLILQKLIPRCLDMILVAVSLCPYFPFNSENASPRNDLMTFALFAERRCQQRRWTPPPTWAPCQAPIQPPPPPSHFFRSVFSLNPSFINMVEFS